MYKQILFFIIACFFSTFNVYANQSGELTARTDRGTISVEETVTLNIRYTGTKRNWKPNLSQLEANFEILNQNHNNRFTYSNGKTESLTEWTLVLFPRKPGKLLIPSFKADTLFSDAIVVTVTDPVAPPKGITQDVFVETYIDKSSAYVQEQIRLTYRLYYAVNIDSLNVEPLSLDNVSVEELPEARYKKNINGKQYVVAEFNYALFPQASEPLTVPALSWKLRYSVNRSQTWFDRSGRFTRKNLKTEEKHVDIKPIPDSFPKGKTWLPSTRINISENWSNPPNSITIGEPTTRSLTLNADGLMPSQLPQLFDAPGTTTSIPGLKIYNEQPESQDEKTTEGITSTKTESAALVATQGGEIPIEPIRIPWWDTASDTLQYAELPKQTIVVKGQALPATSPITPLPGQASTTMTNPVTEQYLNTLIVQLRIWQIAAIFFLITTLITPIVAIKITKKRSSQSESTEIKSQKYAKDAYRQLTQSCRTNNYEQIRKALLLWASLFWPKENINTLEDICARITDESLKNQIRALDSVIYSSNTDTSWNGNLLFTALDDWIKNQNKANEKPEKSELASLYGA